MVEYHHVTRNRAPVNKLSRLAVQGMGYFEIQPNRSLAGKCDFVAFAGKGPRLPDVCGEVGEFRGVGVKGSQVYYYVASHCLKFSFTVLLFEYGKTYVR